MLQITENLAVPEDRAQAFLATRPAWRGCLSASQPGCRVEVRTPRGRTVLAPPPYSGSRSYSFTLGSTLISFVYTHLGPDRQRSFHADGDPADRSYRFAPGELERFVDSFEAAERSAVPAIEPY